MTREHMSRIVRLPLDDDCVLGDEGHAIHALLDLKFGLLGHLMFFEQACLKIDPLFSGSFECLKLDLFGSFFRYGQSRWPDLKFNLPQTSTRGFNFSMKQA